MQRACYISEAGNETDIKVGPLTQINAKITTYNNYKQNMRN